jgi:Rrf2 family transcriptional regulator, nitric oxide-sensitive transcriptional repressor
MRLQIASQLAIYALLELAADPERQLSVGEMGGKYGISNHHLAKVMNVLGRAKLVRSVRGVGGGYHFSGNARRTTLLDVVELFEEFGAGSSEGHAAGVPGKATDEGRALAGILREIDEIARATLGSITIATMLKLVARHRAGAPARATVMAGRH